MAETQGHPGDRVPEGGPERPGHPDVDHQLAQRAYRQGVQKRDQRGDARRGGPRGRALRPLGPVERDAGQRAGRSG
eukprot:12963894-Alexandrium_andersonii.AAC.1